MDKIKTFKDIKAWQAAHDLVLKIYKVTANFPDNEKFGLVTQMRRAGLSIACNIVEGFARRRMKDGTRFYQIANASLEELKYQVTICSDIKLINKEFFNELMSGCDLAGKVLFGWSQSQSGDYLNYY
jgi:four helix bundle protein